MTAMVEMTVQGIGRLEEGGHVAVLRERGGDRTMGVGIGEGAATWVSAHLARLPVPRPNAHILSLRVIQRLGAHLLRVTVDDNGASEPSGYLEVEASSGICEVGCTPEDAVAVAAYAGVAVMVHPDLLRAHSGPSADVGTEPPRKRPPRRRARPGSDPAAETPNEP